MPKQQITIPIFLPNLGCPHRCVFCDQKKSTSTKQVPGPELIDTMIENYLPHIKKSVRRIELAFFGGSFTGIKRETQETFLRAAHRHLENNTIQGIRLSTRPDYIDDRALELLKKYEVSTVELGVQSFDDSVLEASGRGHSADDVYKAVRYLKMHGFDFVIQLMPGLVGDNRESSLRSASEAASLNPTAVRLYPAVVLKGTGLEELYRSGRYSPLSIEEAIELCKDMFLLFNSLLIPVIRMGIHPFAPGEIPNIVAGPYHPSFGYLVKTRVRRDEMTACMERHIGNGLPGADRVNIRIPERFMEEYLGANRKYCFSPELVQYWAYRLSDRGHPGSHDCLSPCRPQNKRGRYPMLKPNNILTVIIMAIMMAGVSSSPEAAPRKQKTAATGKTVQGPAPVPGKRVLSDFASAYSSPSGLKTLKTYYIGIARNAVEKRGDNSVPVQFHTVGVSGRLTDCGLIMKNIYEARYYRLETEWVFQDIALKSSAPAGKPTAKLPPLDDDTAKKLIADGAGSQYGVTVQEVTLLGKKGSWKLCVPTYQVTARVMVVSKNDIQNTVAFYECLMRSTIAQEKGTWTFVTAGCVYRGKDVADCHIGTMCRTMTQESTIPPISDSEALPVLRKALEAEYGLRKNNITIEKFSLVSRFPSETFGTSITCIMIRSS